MCAGHNAAAVVGARGGQGAEMAWSPAALGVVTKLRHQRTGLHSCGACACMFCWPSSRRTCLVHASFWHIGATFETASSCICHVAAAAMPSFIAAELLQPSMQPVPAPVPRLRLGINAGSAGFLHDCNAAKTPAHSAMWALRVLALVSQWPHHNACPADLLLQPCNCMHVLRLGRVSTSSMASHAPQSAMLLTVARSCFCRCCRRILTCCTRQWSWRRPKTSGSGLYSRPTHSSWM